MRPGKFKMNPSTAIIALVILFLVWYTGALQYFAASITGFGGGGGVVTPGAPEQGGVVVNKPLKIAVIDEFAGSPVASASVKIYEGTQLKESLTTDASGIATSTLNYRSDTQLDIFVSSGNSKAWYKVTVPRMSEADAQAATVNPIELRFFTLASISIQVRDSFGNSYTSGGNLNKTTLGANIVSLTVSWFVANDNTGFKNSFDPINNMDWNAVLFTQVTGTNYEKVIVTGADGSYAVGLNNWYYNMIQDTELTKWKIGNQYKYPGTSSRVLTVDLTGYSGDAADIVFQIVVYTSPDYHRQYGSFGPDAVILGTFTINLVD